MGYDLHITRADDWTDSHSNPISKHEWFSLVQSDPELTLDPDDDLSAHHNRLPIAEASSLRWSDGELLSKNPDPLFIEKMIQIAGQLNARVQGDDGEFYPLPPTAAAKYRPSSLIIIQTAYLVALILSYFLGVAAAVALLIASKHFLSITWFDHPLIAGSVALLLGGLPAAWLFTRLAKKTNLPL